MQGNRLKRVEEQLRRELSEILRLQGAEFGSVIITPTLVKLSPDLKYARVWVSLFAPAAERRELLLRLRSLSAKTRYLLAARIRMRRTPELSYELDETLDNAERIDSILKESLLKIGRHDDTEPEHE